MVTNQFNGQQKTFTPKKVDPTLFLGLFYSIILQTAKTQATHNEVSNASAIPPFPISIKAPLGQLSKYVC